MMRALPESTGVFGGAGWVRMTMPRRDLIDLDAVARPISAGSPTGPNLREDLTSQSLYRQVKDARNTSSRSERALTTADANDPQASNQAQEGLQWHVVRRLAPEILANQSKDLEVCSWLIEALVREHGFAGLCDGFKAATVLISTHWNGLYPAPDEEGISTRVAPLTSLNGADRDGVLIGAIMGIPLVQGSDGQKFTTGHYLQALEVERIEDPVRRAARISGGASPLAALQAAAATCNPQELRTRHEEIEECLRAFDELTTTVDQRSGEDAPPSSRIKKALEDALGALLALGRDRMAVAEAGAMAPSSDAVGAASRAPGAAGAGSGNLGSRDEALAALLRVADFFRRTEPHSPLSYTLEQSVRWARLTLPDLLDELISDEAARESYRKLVGIRKPEPKA
jgi:type VI secretion system protein ImpA